MGWHNIEKLVPTSFANYSRFLSISEVLIPRLILTTTEVAWGRGQVAIHYLSSILSELKLLKQFCLAEKAMQQNNIMQKLDISPRDIVKKKGFTEATVRRQ